MGGGVSGGNCVDDVGEGGSRGRERLVGEGGSKERWRARVASAAAAFLLEYPGNGDVRGACRRKRKFALRREREREFLRFSRKRFEED